MASVPHHPLNEPGIASYKTTWRPPEPFLRSPPPPRRFQRLPEAPRGEWDHDANDIGIAMPQRRRVAQFLKDDLDSLQLHPAFLIVPIPDTEQRCAIFLDQPPGPFPARPQAGIDFIFLSTYAPHFQGSVSYVTRYPAPGLQPASLPRSAKQKAASISARLTKTAL